MIHHVDSRLKWTDDGSIDSRQVCDKCGSLMRMETTRNGSEWRVVWECQYCLRALAVLFS